MRIINEPCFYHFSGSMFSKLFCVNILQLLLMIIVILYVWLSGMNIKTLNIWREICLGPFCLIYSATLFHFCNHAHYFANTVRYQKILCEDIYGAFLLCYRLEGKSRSFGTKYCLHVLSMNVPHREMAFSKYSTNRN